jgi:hypothetical protein
MRGGRNVSDKPERSLQELRDERRSHIESQLQSDIAQYALPNAIYWVAIVGGSFALNLILLILVTGG